VPSDPTEKPTTDGVLWSPLEIAAQAAMLEYLQRSRFAQAAPPDAAVRWVLTGVNSNTHNGVFATRLPPDGIDEQIAQTVARLSGHPAIWHLGPDDTPANLAERLAAAGCRPERAGVVMGTRISEIPHHAAPVGVMIREVVDIGAVEHWRRVAAALWPEESFGQLRWQAQLYASLPLGPTARWRHWLAWVAAGGGRREAVGMVSAFANGPAVLIEHLGVVPAFRGGGVGAALVSTAARAAAGSAFAVLGPTSDSGPFYTGLGFTRQRCVADRQFYLP
jgi:GNAT superfamily N-acetyltransferase